ELKIISCAALEGCASCDPAPEMRKIFRLMSIWSWAIRQTHERNEGDQAVIGRRVMKFLLLCGIEESKWLKLSDAERDRIMGDYGKLVHELKARGQLLGGAKLDGCANAVTVREKNGTPLTTDGPFAETKEQVGGYHLVECKD